jgi:hypothetical protein
MLLAKNLRTLEMVCTREVQGAHMCLMKVSNIVRSVFTVHESYNRM